MSKHTIDALRRDGITGPALERKDVTGGNGGLGRLAACFLDSFAELELPSFGYGLRYHYGTFAQVISQGRQLEQPDDWTRDTPAWELPRHDLRFHVGFGGRVEADAVGVRPPADREQHVAAFGDRRAARRTAHTGTRAASPRTDYGRGEAAAGSGVRRAV